MSDFNIAFNKTMGHEGFYSNDATDVGGETYMGISRKYHSTWAGWVAIDRVKDNPLFPSVLKDDIFLHKAVKSFYKEFYWDKIKLDDCKSQLVADELFDTAVNMGLKRSISFLQRALNLLNRNSSRYYIDLEVDGLMGIKTLSAINSVVSMGDEEYLYKLLNILQGYHYIEYMERASEQEKYARGWLNRVNFKKD